MNKIEYPRIGESVYTTVLGNGLTVYAVKKPGFKKSYASFTTSYGSAMRRFSLGGKMCDTPAGVAHFLEHKMFDMPDGRNALTSLSQNGASPNAYTSDSQTCYYFESTSKFKENLSLLLDFVSTPYFTPESVEKEQGIIGQEIRMTEDNPYFRIYFEMLKCLFEKNPVRDSVAGTIESIAEITADTLHDCFNAFYAPSNMVLSVASGDTEPEEIVEIAEKILSKTRSEVPIPDYGAKEGLDPYKPSFEANMEVSAPIFMTGAKFEPAPHGAALMQQKLLAKLALRSFAGRSSPLYTQLYAEGLVGTDFSYDLSYSGGAAWIEFSGESVSPEKVNEAILKQAEKLCKEGFDEKNFDRVRRASYGGNLRALESFERLCGDLTSAHFHGYSAFEAYDLIGEVKAADSAAFLCDILKPERMAKAIIRPVTKGQV